MAQLNTNTLKCLFAGYAPNVVTTEYIVGTTTAGVKQVIVKEILVNNVDPSATHTITIRFVKNGQASSAAYDVPPGTAATLGKAGTTTSPPSAYQITCNTMLDTVGDFIDIVADAASKVSVRISGIEVS